MSQLTKTAFLSLGSNVGDRAAQIEQALALLEESGVRVLRRSSLYETEPVGAPAQRWFVNCVVEVETELMPLGLLRRLKRTERQLGRSASSGLAPAARRIDIDILIFGSSGVRSGKPPMASVNFALSRFWYSAISSGVVRFSYSSCHRFRAASTWPMR